MEIYIWIRHLLISFIATDSKHSIRHTVPTLPGPAVLAAFCIEAGINKKGVCSYRTWQDYLTFFFSLSQPSIYCEKKPYGSSKYIKYLYILSNFAFNSVYFKKEKIKTKTTFIKLIARNGCVQLFHCYHLLTSHFVSVFSCS